MKILITGIAGFVGRHFVNYLQQIDPKISIIGLYNNSIPVFDQHSMVELVQCNLHDEVLFLSIIQKHHPTHIIHLAAQSSVAASWAKPADTFTNNVSIFINLCEAVRKSNFFPVILSVGSSEIYGIHSAERLLETMVCKPNNPYGIARQTQESMMDLYCKDYGMKLIGTRSFNHFGPGQDTRFVIPSFAKQIMEQKNAGISDVKIQVGNLNIVRDFLDVRDVVAAYFELLNTENYGEIYNVCSGKGTSIGSVVVALSEACGVAVQTVQMHDRIRINDIASIIGDNTKLVATTNWKPKIQLVDSMKDLIDGMGDV